MCGRFANNKKIEEQAAIFDADPRDSTWTPSANCAPMQQLPIVFQHQNNRYLRCADWGFKPDWAKGKPIINAQSESAQLKATFKRSFAQQRCIVGANAFFEWKAQEDGKQAHIFQCTDQAFFAMAAIWETAHNKDGKKIGRFCILTCAANQRIEDIHKRMPVILPPQHINDWLDPQLPIDQVQSLCQSYPSACSDVQVMDNSINNIRNNETSILEPYLLN